jgi:hypothetical protein
MFGNFLGLRVARKLPAPGFQAVAIGLVIIVGALTAIMA